MRGLLRSAIAGGLLAGGVCAVGGMLLAWGRDDLAAFFDAPARTVVLAVTMLMFLAGIAYMPPNALSAGRPDANVSRQMVMPVLAGIAMAALLLVGPYADRRGLIVLPGDVAVRAAGVVLHVAGAVLSVWGPVHLGRHFSIFATVQDDHVLVTDGPYRFVRHPRYLGVILWAVGAALAFASTIALLPAAAITGLIVWRMIDEERVLAATFGERWDAYARRTRRLVPYLY